MSSWKEGKTAQKSQATEPVSTYGECDTERCSKQKQITRVPLPALLSKAYIFLQKKSKYNTSLSAGEKSGCIFTDVCLSLTSAAKLS